MLRAAQYASNQTLALGPKQALVLKIISDHSPAGIAPRDMLPLIGNNYGNVMDYLSALVSKGYVERVPDLSFKTKGFYRTVAAEPQRRKGSKVRGSKDEA